MEGDYKPEPTDPTTKKSFSMAFVSVPIIEEEPNENELKKIEKLLNAGYSITKRDFMMGQREIKGVSDLTGQPRFAAVPVIHYTLERYGN